MSVAANAVPSEMSQVVIIAIRLIQADLGPPAGSAGVFDSKIAGMPSSKEADAKNKGKAWAVIGAVFALIVAIVVCVIAIVLAVVTFGAAGSPMMRGAFDSKMGGGSGPGSSALDAAIIAINNGVAAAFAEMTSFFNQAASTGHPLASEMAGIMARLQAASQGFMSDCRRDPMTARNRALAEILRSVQQIDGLAARVGSLNGPCLGDPVAPRQACRGLAATANLLSGAVNAAQMATSTNLSALSQALSTAAMSLQTK